MVIASGPEARLAHSAHYSYILEITVVTDAVVRMLKADNIHRLSGRQYE